MNADKRDGEEEGGKKFDTIPVRPTGEKFSVSMAAMETQLTAYNKKQRNGNEDREAPLLPPPPTPPTATHLDVTVFPWNTVGIFSWQLLDRAAFFYLVKGIFSPSCVKGCAVCGCVCGGACVHGQRSPCCYCPDHLEHRCELGAGGSP